jgi:hypothetical protein
MRELYAVELRSSEVGAEVTSTARTLIGEWAARPFEGVDSEALDGAGEIATPNGRIVVSVGAFGEWLMRWWFNSDVDPSLVWLAEAAVTGPDTPIIVTVRIRIGQSHQAAGVVAPLLYDFRSPAVVRTLLRQMTVQDAGHQVTPLEEPVGASAVDGLVEFLSDPLRRLPVVVLSGDPITGRPVVNARELALELAGLLTWQYL